MLLIFKKGYPSLLKCIREFWILTIKIDPIRNTEGSSICKGNGRVILNDVLLCLQGQANIEIRNNRQQTPLLLAVSQGHTSIVELLVSSGADLRVEDEDGDTTLHLALMRQSVTSEQENTPMLDSVSVNCKTCNCKVFKCDLRTKRG